ncbi:MAG TPA: class I mannose-6-phosphate isomerase [Bryobacteraceae bacterium]|jgi:mannose-6-phosphate isomerase
MKLERLTPRFLEKVWGAVPLEPWFTSTGQKIGEVWLEGKTPLPLLVKFLFTSENLSVQVHPADEYAAAHHQSPGKTEMWHILAAEPGARIAAGFREPISAGDLRAASESGEIMDLLAWHEASPGDTFFIPAGTVHAIGAGLVLCEIQQVSDVTYRLFDYHRGRELHLDRSLDVSHRGPYTARTEPCGDVLVSCSHFTVKRYRVEDCLRLDPPPQILIAIEGQGECCGQPLRAGEAWYAPLGSPALDLRGHLTLLGASVTP